MILGVVVLTRQCAVIELDTGSYGQSLAIQEKAFVKVDRGVLPGIFLLLRLVKAVKDEVWEEMQGFLNNCLCRRWVRTRIVRISVNALIGKGTPKPVDAFEPFCAAEAVKRLRLKDALVTSVTRDDLPDGGARQVA